jgi:hypothetical protein
MNLWDSIYSPAALTPHWCSLTTQVSTTPIGPRW